MGGFPFIKIDGNDHLGHLPGQVSLFRDARMLESDAPTPLNIESATAPLKTTRVRRRKEWKRALMERIVGCLGCGVRFCVAFLLVSLW